jgi:hypothetical protein
MMAATRIAIVGHRHHCLSTDNALDLSIEWVAPDKRAAIRLVRRIRQRNIDAVVLIQADLSHGISVPILTACRVTGISFTACEKCSQTQIRSALDALVSSNERQSP